MNEFASTEQNDFDDDDEYDFDFTIPLNDDNRINPHTLCFGRSRSNDPVILGETLGGDGFVIRLDDNNKPVWISGRHGETVFEDECSIFKPDGSRRAGDKPHSNNALREAFYWLDGRTVPDFSGLPLEISNVEYFEEHPFARKKRDVVVSFDINGWDGDVAILTDDYQDILGEDHANMLAGIQQFDSETQERYRAIYCEIANLLRAHLKTYPYRMADSMLSYYMEHGVREVAGDDSELIRYDIPIITYKGIPENDVERKANGIPARLVVNRKNSYWECIVYVNDDFYSKSAQLATPTNGGFGSYLSHKEFLHKVHTVSLFVSAVDFDFVSDDFEPIKLAS